MSTASNLTGYGPRTHLMFSGQEEDYDLWEVRLLDYMNLQCLKKTILPRQGFVEDPDDHATKNEMTYSELVMLLDEISLSVIMNDAVDDGRQALAILRDHYKGSDYSEALKSRKSTTVSKNSEEDTVMKAESSAKNTLKCYGCRRSGHYAISFVRIVNVRDTSQKSAKRRKVTVLKVHKKVKTLC